MAAGDGDLGGERGAVGVADLVRLWRRGDFDQLIAGGQDGDARTREDLDMSGSDGGECSDVSGSEAGAGGDERIAAAGFAAGGNDVAAGTEVAVGLEADTAVVDLDMFEHDDGIGAFRDGCAGHDLECGVGCERRSGRWLAGAEDAGDGQPVAATEGGGLNGIAIPGGAVEGREIAVGMNGDGENAVESFEEGKVLGWLRSFGGEALGLFENEGGGLLVGEDDIHGTFYFALISFQPPGLSRLQLNNSRFAGLVERPGAALT